jgi:DNA-binding NarL/FixJ family response regulator
VNGVELLQNDWLNQVELVLLDWAMPGLVSETTLQALKGQAFRAPAIVVTALSDPKFTETVLRHGATATLLQTKTLN